MVQIIAACKVALCLRWIWRDLSCRNTDFRYPGRCPGL